MCYLSAFLRVNFVVWALVLAGIPFARADGPYLATGIKIGEVTETTAIVWVRTTRDAARAGGDAPVPVVRYRDPESGKLRVIVEGHPDREPVVEFPRGATIDSIEGAVPGAPGEVRVLYRAEGASDWQQTDWAAADPDRDFTHQFALAGLQPATRYELRIETRSAEGSAGQALDGRFSTAPPRDVPARVVFAVTTGQEYNDQDAPGGGYRMYPAIRALDPQFFVHTGDILYYDKLAKSLPLARWHWARVYSLPTNVDFHRHVASYFIKDDHDTWMNDCWPTLETRFMGEFTFAQGQAVFLEQVPMGERTYRSFRWGRDLEVWLVEGRDFRSPNTMPDGPDKSIWGVEQKAWFKETLAASDATFRLLISPTPLVGPDRDAKGDNHANRAFAHEGRELREFLAQQKNTAVLCGDRHWQYVSVDSSTGLREYSCGPASDQHAGGWKQDDVRNEHRYLNVVGGFLSVTVERADGVPAAIFRHHSVDGHVLNEDRMTGQ